MEHLLSLALSRGFECTQKESQYKELSARYEKMQMDSRLREQLLNQVFQDSGIIIQTQSERKSVRVAWLFLLIQEKPYTS